MRTVHTITQLRAELVPARRDGRSIGLVPTMGAFHDGHLSLMRAAREACDVVVVSLFVNPTQFNDPRDLELYPRDQRRDGELAAERGVDLLFTPEPGELYPAGFATTISVSGVTGELEGRHRGRSHFEGVATVVAKLLNIAGPDVAFFGQKDAQQAVVIRRMVADLDLPVEIRTCPTVRAADGLALSSRNVLLTNAQRAQATCLYGALRAVAAAVDGGEHDPQTALAAGRMELEQAGIEPEYLALVAADTLVPVAAVEGDLLVLVAAPVGATRLIDNLPIRAPRLGRSHADPEVATLSRAPTR